MGMFDDVEINKRDPRFRCPVGHHQGTTGQTKDLGCTMGRARIDGDRFTFTAGKWEDDGGPVDVPVFGNVRMVVSCPVCAIRDRSGFGVVGVFVLEVVNGRIRRVSESGPPAPYPLDDDARVAVCLDANALAELAIATTNHDIRARLLQALDLLEPDDAAAIRKAAE